MSSIYVVDGNTNDRELVFDALRSEEHDVMCFSDAQAALRACASTAPTLLITEAVFKEITGFGLIRGVRSIAPSVPVLVFTRAYSRDDVAALTRGAERVSYLGKPAAAQTIRAATTLALIDPPGLASVAALAWSAFDDVRDANPTHEWRVETLAQAGYPLRLAEAVASSLYVDLHAAVDLVRRGCRPELAARILV